MLYPLTKKISNWHHHHHNKLYKGIQFSATTWPNSNNLLWFYSPFLVCWDHPWLLSGNQRSLNSTMGPCRSRSPTMVPPSLPCLYQTKMVIFFISLLIGFSSHFALRCFADVWVLGIWRKPGWCCSWVRFSGTISGKFFYSLFKRNPFDFSYDFVIPWENWFWVGKPFFFFF